MMIRSMVWRKTPAIGAGYRAREVAGPVFGRRKRQRLEEEGVALDAAAQWQKELRERRPGVSEDDAWAAVSGRFGFAMKPAWHSWSSFLFELERFEMVWNITSPYDQLYRIQWKDHYPSMPPANGDPFATLFLLDSFESRAGTTAEFLGTLRDMHASGVPAYNIPFNDGHVETTLELETYLHHSCTVEAAPDQTYLWRQASSQRQLASSEAPAPGSSLSVAVPVEQPCTEVAVVAPPDQRPWVCVRGRINNLDGETSPMLFDMSLPGFTSVVLRAWLGCLNSESGGYKCYTLVPKSHMVDELIPLWRSVRAMAMMHAEEWPIDPRLLTERTPNFHSTRH